MQERLVLKTGDGFALVPDYHCHRNRGPTPLAKADGWQS